MSDDESVDVVSGSDELSTVTTDGEDEADIPKLKLRKYYFLISSLNGCAIKILRQPKNT